MLRRCLVSPIVLLIVFVVAAPSFAQYNVWRSQNGAIIDANIVAIQMISGNTANAIGDDGTFVVITDSGQTWHMTPHIGGKSNLKALSFLDSLNGMVVGGSGGNGDVIKTTNGGASWQVMDPKKGNSPYAGVLMISKLIAIVIGPYSTILRTTDGGISWEEYNAEFGIDLLTKIKKIRNDLVVISGSFGNFLFSADSGKNWNKVKSQFGNDVKDFSFENDSVAVAVGERGMIIRTTDTGQHWKYRDIGAGDDFAISSDLHGIDSRSGRYIAVGGWTWAVYSDDGLTWKKGTLSTFVNTAMNFNDVSMWDTHIATAVGDNGYLVRTTDGGASWKFIPKDPAFATLIGVAFFRGDTANGIVVGEGGTILKTSDGGNKWTVVKTPLLDWKTDLYTVAFSDSNTVWIGGEFGTLLKSTDQGATWVKIPLPTALTLRSLAFYDRDLCWIGADSGLVFETKTGGVTWHYLMRDTSRRYLGNVSIFDKKNGMIGAFRTTNGGNSWVGERAAPYTTSHIITDKANVVTILIDNSFSQTVVIKTTIGDSIFNYGTTSQTYVPLLSKFDFGDSLYGTAVGQYGRALQTTNGGRNWAPQSTGTNNYLIDISMPLPNVATTVGSRGTIKRRTNTLPLKTVREHSASLNEPIRIISIYPNPAREASTLQFQLQQPMPIELRIYDLKGVLIQSSDLGMMTAGEYEQLLSFAGLATGGYIVELRSPEYSKHIILQAGE